MTVPPRLIFPLGAFGANTSPVSGTEVCVMPSSPKEGAPASCRPLSGLISVCAIRPLIAWLLVPHSRIDMHSFVRLRVWHDRVAAISSKVGFFERSFWLSLLTLNSAASAFLLYIRRFVLVLATCSLKSPTPPIPSFLVQNWALPDVGFLRGGAVSTVTVPPRLIFPLGAFGANTSPVSGTEVCVMPSSPKEGAPASCRPLSGLISVCAIRPLIAWLLVPHSRIDMHSFVRLRVWHDRVAAISSKVGFFERSFWLSLLTLNSAASAFLLYIRRFVLVLATCSLKS